MRESAVPTWPIILTDAEKAIMAARFDRIEPYVREALRPD
jgi:hypothetical protein